MAKKARLSKEALEIDLSGVTAKERRAKKVIPEGIYRAKVISVGPKKFSTERKGIEWVLEVIDDGPGKGARFWHNNVFIDVDGSVMTDSLWTIRGTLQALTPKVKIPEKIAKFPWSKLVNRTVALEVADGEDNEGRPRSEILDVFNEDLIEEDEEIDEAEDDEEEEEDEEDWDEEEDEDEDEDEDEEDEVDIHSMDAKTLRAHARSLGHNVKGLKKAEILELLEDEGDEEDEEDEDEDEFDLEEDEL